MPAAPDPPQAAPHLAAIRRPWASLIRRVYEVDPLLCPHCRALVRAVSFITEPDLIRRILDYLPTAPKRAERRHPHSPSRPQRTTAPTFGRMSPHPDAVDARFSDTHDACRAVS